MATIKEDYVSFEVARLLKEKGFQQTQDNCGYFTTEMIYSINVDDNDEHHFTHQYPAGVCNKDKYIAAPTLQMTMKWLREVHKIFIETSVSIDINGNYHYSYSILNKECKYVRKEFSDFDWNYNQACEAAIKYCIENLITMATINVTNTNQIQSSTTAKTRAGEKDKKQESHRRQHPRTCLCQRILSRCQLAERERRQALYYCLHGWCRKRKAADDEGFY